MKIEDFVGKKFYKVIDDGEIAIVHLEEIQKESRLKKAFRR